MSQELLQLTENQRRLFLKHRFGITDAELKKEDLPFPLVLATLKDSHKTFLHSTENSEKLSKMIAIALKQVEPVPTETTIRIHYRINLEELIKVVSNEIEELGTKEYYDKIPTRLEKKEIIAVALKTKNFEMPNEHTECIIRGVAFFHDKILKLNRGSNKVPSATLYKIQTFDVEKLKVELQKFIDSFENPLDAKTWDHALNEALGLEKINKVIKKEHSIGNCAWITAKLFVCSIVYGIILLSLKDLNAKETIAHQIAFNIAEGWYKFFTNDDRTRALYEYCQFHGLKEDENALTEANRISHLKKFLNENKEGDFDRELLQKIYIKMLNWKLAEYLNQGDVASARNLLKMEVDNKAFNPLFYAIRNSKLALAELLANDQYYVNAKDKSGNTPLMVAADWGEFEIVKILIRHQKKNQLNLHETNEVGDNVLHFAVRNNEREIVEYVINTEPSLLNSTNIKNETPLQLAIDNQYAALVKLLSSPTTMLKGQQKL